MTNAALRSTSRRKRRSALLVLCAWAALLAGCAQPALTRAAPGRHVVLHSSLSTKTGGAMQREADRTVEEICAFLGLTPPARRAEVLLFHSRWALQRHLAEACPEMTGAGAACFEQDPGLFVIALAERWRETETLRYLRHELTHYVVASYFDDVPPWLGEGLAQFFELGPAYGRMHPDCLKSLKRQLRRDRGEILTPLVLIPVGAPLTRKQYAQAWGLTYYLLKSDPDGVSRVRTYLEEVRADRDAVEQFRETFGRSPEEIEPTWRERLLETRAD